jgi:hypothetical protein
MAWSPDLLRLLDVHEHGGVRWFRQEGFERWLDVMWAAGRRQRPGAGPARALAAWRRRWAARMRASGYRWSPLLDEAAATAATGVHAGRGAREARGRRARRATKSRHAGGEKGSGGAAQAAARRRRKRG